MSSLESLAIQPNVYYTPEEAADLLRVSAEVMLMLLESGRVRGIKISDARRVLGATLLDLSAQEQEAEASLVSEWLIASSRSLREVWDNEEDAVYDHL